jgi:hypothetical protein
MARNFDDHFSALASLSPLRDEINHGIEDLQKRAQDIHTKMADFESPLIFKTLDCMKKDIHGIFDKVQLNHP